MHNTNATADVRPCNGISAILSQHKACPGRGLSPPPPLGLRSLGTNFAADATACVVSERLGPLLDPSSLAGTNFPADATACAVSERLRPLLNPGSLAGRNCPTDATGLRQLIDRVEDVVAGDL